MDERTVEVDQHLTTGRAAMTRRAFLNLVGISTGAVERHLLTTSDGGARHLHACPLAPPDMRTERSGEHMALVRKSSRIPGYWILLSPVDSTQPPQMRE